MPDPRPQSTRLLVVDDERAIADTLGIILRRAGYEVQVAYDGVEAVAAAKAFRPDIVLADYFMPKMDGIEAGVQIQQLFPACRIIMLSGHTLSTAFAPHRERGYNFVLLSKPIPPTDLLQAIDSERILPTPIEKPLRILNVDDIEEHRYSVSRMLTHAGFEVSEAASGADALREAIDAKPDMILLDIHLPDKDGYDVCAALKQNPDTAQISVVHLTGFETNEQSVARSRQVGADEFLTYPIRPSHLLKRIRELLQLNFLREGE